MSAKFRTKSQSIEYYFSSAGGVSQADFDSSIATLTSKDISQLNAITSHISQQILRVMPPVSQH